MSLKRIEIRRTRGAALWMGTATVALALSAVVPMRAKTSEANSASTKRDVAKIASERVLAQVAPKATPQPKYDAKVQESRVIPYTGESLATSSSVGEFELIVVVKNTGNQPWCPKDFLLNVRSENNPVFPSPGTYLDLCSKVEPGESYEFRETFCWPDGFKSLKFKVQMFNDDSGIPFGELKSISFKLRQRR